MNDLLATARRGLHITIVFANVFILIHKMAAFAAETGIMRKNNENGQRYEESDGYDSSRTGRHRIYCLHQDLEYGDTVEI